MATHKKGPAGTGPDKPTDISELRRNTIPQDTKRKTILCALAFGMRLTRFTAEHLRDHCLSTTISEIGRYDGIFVSRKGIHFFNSAGHKVHCNLYWLEPAEQEKALQLLGVAV